MRAVAAAGSQLPVTPRYGAAGFSEEGEEWSLHLAQPSGGPARELSPQPVPGKGLP